MSEETPKEEVGELKEDLTKLREDLTHLRGDLEELARTAGSSAQRQVRRTVDDLEAQCEETMARGRDEIRQHPFTTVLGAALLGFCVGVLSGRK